MKKFLYFAVMSLIILSLSGCGGGSGDSKVINSDSETETASYEVTQVAVLTSPAFEIYKDYKIFTSVDLEGMDTARYYVASIGDDASQVTINLGLSEGFDADKSLAIINASTGAVVFAYNPSGTGDTWKIGGNVFIRSNGTFMRYRALTIGDDYSTADYSESNTDSNKYSDADVLSSAYQTERGITSINIGTGSSVSFIETDEDTRPRNINTSGDVFRLNRKVNTFSGIIFKK